jgi:hypothetical protein
MMTQDDDGCRENADVNLVASAALEIAASDPTLQDRASLLAAAMTLLTGALVKIAITGNAHDISAVHTALDVLWNGATIEGNAPGGDA